MISDEVILKLFKGTIEDVWLGMGYLIKRSDADIKHFFDLYGKSDKVAPYFLSQSRFRCISTGADMYYVERGDIIIWLGDSDGHAESEILLLNKKYHTTQLHYWKNLNI